MFIQSINSFSQNTYNYNSVPKRSNFLTKPLFSVSFQGDNDYFDYDAELQKQLDKRSGLKKWLGWGKKKAKEDTNKLLIGFNMSKQALLKEKDNRIADNKEALKKQAETVKALEKQTQILEANLELAKKNRAQEKTILSLEAQLKETQERHKAEKADYDKKTKMNNDLKTQQEILTKREAGKGWEKIAGREDLKTLLDEIFINKIAQEKAGYDVNMPNGILFYGPPGTGKTRFAQAFAEQSGCDFVSINTMQSNDDILIDLKDALKHAKRVYNSPETPKKRTIILLDDFNSIAELSDEEKKVLEAKQIDFEDTSTGQLVEYLSDCANKYKTTIFMTTNHPKRIDSELLDIKLIPHQVFLGPPMTMDAAEMFKYHLNGFTDQEIDYLKLSKEVCKAFANGEAYSSQGIVNIIDYAKDHSKGSQITEAALLDAIEKVKPDISKRTLDAFLDEMDDALNRYNLNDDEVL